MDPISRVEALPVSDVPGTNVHSVKTTNGGCVNVVESNGLGLPLVLVHDLFSSHQQFEGIVNGAIGRRYRVVCPDLPGHGASPAALFPNDTYNVAALADTVIAIIDHFKIPRAIIVGSGLGAQIALAASARLGARAVGIILCDMDLCGSAGPRASTVDHRVSQNLARPLCGKELSSVASMITTFSGSVGVIGGSFPADLLLSLNANQLWRSSVQLVPGSSSGVVVDQPKAFTTMLRAFASDLLSAPAPPETETPMLSEPQSTRADWKHSKQSLNPNFRGRVEPGTMPHPGARFEAPLENDVQGDEIIRDRTDLTNPNRRGRVVAGTMPHPSSRFEVVEQAEEDSSSELSTNPHKNNPNFRGRIIPGTMPHPAARFDYSHVESSSNQQNAATQAINPNLTNPNRKGRVVGGTMPHPASRFEDVQGGPFDSPSKNDTTSISDPQGANPNARGRIVPGTMPHPSSRFETAQGGSRPSTRVTQAPGGNTTFVFG